VIIKAFKKKNLISSALGKVCSSFHLILNGLSMDKTIQFEYKF